MNERARTWGELNGAPLAVTQEYADFLKSRVEVEAKSGHLEEAARVASPRSSALASGADGVGVINIMGVIGPRSQGWAVDTTVESVAAEFDAYLQDDRVGTIVLNIDSPGGLVYGTPELAARIAEGAKKKRVVAYTGGMMASAAYWIGSAANEIVAAPSSQVGSIGVYTMHVDVSRALANAGIVVTLIKAGANKAEGSPYSPLSDADRASAQRRIDDYYEQFVSAVAQHRGATKAAVRGGYGTGSVLNASHAYSEGLVDRIGTFDALMSELLGGAPMKKAARTNAAAFTAESTFGTAVSAAAASTIGNAVWTITGNGTAATPLIYVQSPAPVASAVPLPADEARSQTVDPNTTAVTPAAQPDTREADLRALARAHGKDLAWLDAASASGKSVAAVTQELLAGYASAASATAVLPGRADPSVALGTERETAKPFAKFGDFLVAVRNAAADVGVLDRRLAPLAAVTGMGQNDPSSAGFLVSPQYSSIIWDKLSSDPNSILGMTDNYTVEGESLTFNANAETSRATGSRWGGVRGYWIAEGGQLTASKPTFRQVKVEPQQLAVFVYVTDKLLKNSPVALEQYVSRTAADEINFMTGDAILNGDGVGKPKGLITAACTVSVAKETNQPNDTINQINITKMWARLHPRARAGAVWFHNVDVEPQLDQLSTTVTNIAGSENVGGYANKVFDSERRTLKGRPLVACEFCGTLGDVGDLVLADMSGYLTGTRGGVESAMSMHIRFDYLETAFRFVYEVDGQPWLASAQTPFKGTNTLSTFVTLAAR